MHAFLIAALLLAAASSSQAQITQAPDKQAQVQKAQVQQVQMRLRKQTRIHPQALLSVSAPLGCGSKNSSVTPKCADISYEVQVLGIYGTNPSGTARDKPVGCTASLPYSVLIVHTSTQLDEVTVTWVLSATKTMSRPVVSGEFQFTSAGLDIDYDNFGTNKLALFKGDPVVDANYQTVTLTLIAMAKATQLVGHLPAVQWIPTPQATPIPCTAADPIIVNAAD